MRIVPDGCNDLFGALEKSLKEANKAVLKENIQTIGLLAEALGPAAKTLVKKLLVPSLKILSDKQNLVRAKVLEAIGKWAEALGPEHVITYLAMQLEIENPELRLNSLNWIMENRLEIKKAEHASMAVPLTCCLIDKDAKVRKEAEKVIIEVMPYIGSEPFQKQCSSFKPAQ